MTTSSDPAQFVVRQIISVDDVDTKFAEKKEFYSPEFFCCDDPRPTIFRCKLRFGLDDENAISAYVDTRAAARKFTIISFGFTILNKEHQQIKRTWNSKSGVFESGQASDWGWKIAYKKTLPLPPTLHFFFEMTYEPSSEAVKNPTRISLQQDFSNLLEDASFADVSFSVQGETIKAHKAVLGARSTYFKAMLDPDKWGEGASNQVEVADVKPKIFKDLLRCLYTDDHPKFAEEETLDLLIAADKYGLDSLRTRCESVIAANFGPQSVVEALLVADKIDRQDLKTAAMSYIKVKAKTLKKSPCWSKLKTNPDLLLELLGSFREISG